MSTPDLHARAARFFLLAEQASRLPPLSRMIFWEMSVSSVRDPTACLPALAAAVRKEHDSGCLLGPAQHPLPVKLSPETLPWYDALISAWEPHRASSDMKQRNLARRALVRLDGCAMPDGMVRPSRLPEWLAEARQIVGAGSEPARTEPARTGQWQMEELEALAALAAWRPAPGVVTSPETLREWVSFWQEMGQSGEPILKGIAARVLLNLPEADLRAASLQPVSPEQLLRDLAAAIPAAAERTDRSRNYNYLPRLDWQPGEGNTWPAAGVAEVARAWLEVASHNYWWCRQMAWQQLIRWDRAGSLATCGIDLLPRLVRAAQTEKYGDVLWEMARWNPAAEVFTGTERPDRLDLLQQLETHWQHHRQSSGWLFRASGWLAGIRLHQAGLASEPPDSFREAYMAAVAKEHDSDVLLVLAQWSPGAAAPAAFHREWQQFWQRRLEDTKEYLRKVAAFALARQALEAGTGDALRRLTLETWRTGTNEGQAARQMLDTVLFHFHEVRAHLAAGSVPDFGEKPVPPAQRQYRRLALPPGRIAGGEWRIENGELKMENEELKMENHEGALKPGNQKTVPTPGAAARTYHRQGMENGEWRIENGK